MWFKITTIFFLGQKWKSLTQKLLSIYRCRFFSKRSFQIYKFRCYFEYLFLRTSQSNYIPLILFYSHFLYPVLLILNLFLSLSFLTYFFLIFFIRVWEKLGLIRIPSPVGFLFWGVLLFVFLGFSGVFDLKVVKTY